MIAGRYTLEREVGRGGMGAVWLATDEVLGREVALKRVGMAPGGSTPDLTRAEREARLAARLNHPHVVAVYDLVQDGEDQWLVMEYVAGTDLGALVQRDGPLEPDTAAVLLAQAADALAAAHAAGIVHRDVKPSNILVTPEAQVKLSDFGIARAEADASLTQTGLVTGSPAYLSPEVASGETAGPASDVWSLGATLFHALSGRPPYEVGGNLMGALYRIVHEDPPRLGRETAGWLAPVLRATMKVDPTRRWSMAQVRDFLAAGPSRATGAATTAVLPTADAEPRPAPRPAPAPPPAAAAAPPAATASTSTHGRRRPGVLLGAALAVAGLVVVALVAWALGSQDGADRDGRSPGAAGSERAGRTGSPSPSGSRSPSPSTTTTPSESASPSESGSPSGSSSPATAVTAAGMRSFVADYLATVTSDPKSAWQRLTPRFQAASGGYGQYRSFWATIADAQLVSAQPDPASGRISYVVDYQRTDGSQTRDSTTLTLTGHDGDYRIAAEG